jgi:hypothetical protein
MLRHLPAHEALVFFGSLLALTTLAVVGPNAISYQPPFTLLPYAFLPSLAYSVAWFLLVLPKLRKVLLAAALLSGASFLLLVLWGRLSFRLSMINAALAPAALAIGVTMFGFVHGLLHVGLIKSAEDLGFCFTPWVTRQPGSCSWFRCTTPRAFHHEAGSRPSFRSPRMRPS